MKPLEFSPLVIRRLNCTKTVIALFFQTVPHMTKLLSLPQVQPVAARKPDPRVLLPLDQYDHILVSFSGGKDSLASVLNLLEQGVSPDRIQLWHQCVDGKAGVDPPFADWPCTESYVREVGNALGIRVLFQWRLGGFLGEMLKQDAQTQPVRFDRQDGTIGEAGGIKGKFVHPPQVPAAQRQPGGAMVFGGPQDRLLRSGP